jgi:hypothetical protein
LIFQDPDRSPYLDYFIHPVPAAAMVLMAVNDHWLKERWPSWWTGKFSDFLGVFYFPLLLVALICLFQNFVLRQRPVAYLTRLKLALAMGVTVVMMTSIKISPAVALWIAETFSRWFFAIRIVADPTDLIAFSSLALTYFYARPFLQRPPSGTAGN